MSYAPAGYNANAARYQELEVMSAKPGQLVVMVYDHVLVCLRRADLAMEHGDIEARATQLGKVRDAIDELLVTLDHEKGGAIAGQLASLYAFFLAELVDVNRRNDRARLGRISAMVRELRDAFAQIAGAPGAATAA